MHARVGPDSLVALLLPAVVALAASAALTPAVRAVARSLGLIARPSTDRWHVRPTALLGGIAVYGGFVAGLGTWFALVGLAGRARLEWVGILSAGTLMFLVGLVDDKRKLRPTTKIIFQALAAAVVISCGVEYPVTPWYPVNVIATFFWFLGLTNALNLLDNMDGVAVGVAGIAAVFLAAAFAWERSWGLSALCLVVAGAALGFLPFNFHRASIFMGDSGSLFLGSLLASLAAAYPSAASASVISVMFIPAAVVVLPILDTGLVTLARILAGRPVSMGGRDHTSHRLVALGLREPQVALLLYAVSAGGGLLAVMLRGSPPQLALPVGALFVAALLLATAYLGKMHRYAPTERHAGAVTSLVSDLLHKRRAFEVVLDLILFTAAYQLAFLLRGDGGAGAAQGAVLQRTLAVAIIAKSVSFGLLGVYRGAWHQLTTVDVHRLVGATLVGSLLAAAALALAFPAAHVPAAVFVLDGLLALVLVTGARASFRSLQLLRHALGPRGKPVLLYGAGEAAPVLIRELIANPSVGLRPVGFLDDDPEKCGRAVHGYPVLGTGRDLARLAAAHQVAAVVLCSRHLPERVGQTIRTDCAQLGLPLYQFSVTLDVVRAPAEVRAEPLRARHA